MASNCVDLVLHDLEQLHIIPDILDLELKLRILRTFLMCGSKWSNNDVYLESKDDKKVSLQSFLHSIEDNVNKYRLDIHSLRLKKESEGVDGLGGVISALKPIVSDFKENIKSLKHEIIKVYIALWDCSSLQSSSCMRNDELVEFIDSLVQNLVDVLRSNKFFSISGDYDNALHAQVEALEYKLTFLKNFVRFANLRGVEDDKLEDLLTHTEVVSINAARLSYMCSFYKEDEEVRDPKMCSAISELQRRINPVDLSVCETYVKVLRAAKTSALLHSTEMDKHILRDFNDSVISSLWELLWCTTNFMDSDSAKDQMQLLYEGLRFLGTILRELPEENMDALNEKIGGVIGEAGITLCLLSLNEVTGDVVSLGIRDAGDFYAMIVDVNRDIKLIKAEVAEVHQPSMMESLPSCHSFKGEDVRKTSSTLAPPKGKIPIIHEEMVSLDDEAETVMDSLTSGSTQLEIVPIVGMPGLGKTTLAKNIFHNPSITHHFHVRLWCCVSQVYTKKNVLLQLLFDDDKYSSMNQELLIKNEDDLLEMLYRKLKRNKYLVVFDDVWDIRVWNDLKLALPNDKNGSRILFTSRISTVGSKAEFGREPHNLRSLTDGESWELLQKKVFGKDGCPQALHGLGMKIAKNCKGLPLTIVIIAGVLATIDHNDWEEVAKSLTSTIVYQKNQCKSTLELSYEYLPHYLKPCLLYFGAFREDQEIHTNKLMWLWIAEGFVQNTEPKRLEEVAEEYMMDLIGRNLVMVTKQRSIGGVKACCIHDLLHEFCKAKAKEENFLQVLHGYDELSSFNEPPKLQRLSICSNQEEFKKSRLFCPHLHSLLFFHQLQEYDKWTADISFAFCIYKHLRVLDLEQIILMHKCFPSEIESLVELRYLAIRGIMRFLPSSIANLSNLQTWIVISCIGTISLPETIWNMKKLRHLHLLGCSVTCSLPDNNLESSPDLCNLDTFSTVIVSLDQSVENIMRKIPNVRQLKIRLSAAGESIGYCNMSGLASLESLEVSPLSHLRLSDIEFSFPSTLKALSLENLFLPWSKISLIEQLPNLEVLKLLKESFKGERWEMNEGGFPSIRFLRLENVDVVEWTDTGSDGDHFPCLQKLHLVGEGLKLKKLPSCLGSISTLEMIVVEQCDGDSFQSLVGHIKEEQENWGNENLKILMINLPRHRSSSADSSPMLIDRYTSLGLGRGLCSSFY